MASVMYIDVQRPTILFLFDSLRRFGGSQAVTTGATNVTIVSADKDLAQLVTRRVNMLNVYTGERLGPEEVSFGTGAPCISVWYSWV